jgi:hypothetical protein
MGFFSSSVSMTRYRVEGRLPQPLIEQVGSALKRNTIAEIDREDAEMAVGWTSFYNPYFPDFEGSDFIVGAHIVFSLRIDKKSIPAKVIKKHYTLELRKVLAETGREYLSQNEKRQLKEQVIHALSLRVPATPNIYDLVWNYEGEELWFFSNLKNANEELETLFTKSFKLQLIRLFPFTLADLTLGLSDRERDVLTNLAPSKFAV